jgi:hypothetical protein
LASPLSLSAAAGIEGAEALAGGAGQFDVDGMFSHAVIAPAPGDLAGQAGADGAIVLRIG